MRRAAGAALAALALAGLTSCKVDVQLGVRAAEDGSGVVEVSFTLDREALDSLGGDLDDRLRVADLLQAGWHVETERIDGGGARVVADKSFATPAQLTEVVDELSGDAGPFREFRLTRDRSRFRTEFEFTGRVDLGAGVAGSALDVADEGLQAPLADEGIDVEALRAYLDERVGDAFTFQVVADLPGKGSDNAPAEIDGEPAWRPKAGETTELRATSSALDRARLGLLGLAGILGVGAIAAATGVRLRRGGLGRQRTDPS